MDSQPLDAVLGAPDNSPASRAQMRAQAAHLSHSLQPSLSSFSSAVHNMIRSLDMASLDPHHVNQLPVSATELHQLNAHTLFSQLNDFAENLQHQLLSLVIRPLDQYKEQIESALAHARSFDEESEALDAAALKYLSISRDSPVETRAFISQELSSKAAGVALHMFDVRTSLRQAYDAQSHVPLKVLGELLVAQLAYHQSCARLLTEAMPQVVALLARTDEVGAALRAQIEEAALMRQTLPRPQVREGATLAEGWLFKASFNLEAEGAAVKDQLNRLKPWNRRWFVFCSDGKLYYYKSPDDTTTAKVPIDMLMLSSVSPVNGPLEFELQIGGRTLRLKVSAQLLACEAPDTSERRRWMGVLTSYMLAHAEERKHAQARMHKLFTLQGTGIRDLEYKASQSEYLNKQGYLLRQDTDGVRRWRKWWCEVDDGALTCTLYDSLRLMEPSRDRKHSTTKAASSRTSQEPNESQLQIEPFRVVQSISLPLGTATVREVISPRDTVVLQAQSYEEMEEWTEVIQNATAALLGCSRTKQLGMLIEGSVCSSLLQVSGNTMCADCAASDPLPSWASINLGVLLCLACAGVHRQMGVHISKVRSLELDTKEWSDALLAMMTEIGNSAANSIWFKVPLQNSGRQTSISADASTAQRETFIRQKYESRQFVGSTKPPPATLHMAALTNDVVTAARCHAQGCDLEERAPTLAMGVWTQQMVEMHGGRMAVHIAAAEGNAEVLEFLLQNAVTVDAEDATGKTPLLLAVKSRHAGCVVQLIRRGANISHSDHSHQTPVAAAEEPGFESILKSMLAHKLAQDEKLLARLGDDPRD